MRTTFALALLTTGCPSEKNPDTLWLAPDRMETAVKLVDKQPVPF